MDIWAVCREAAAPGPLEGELIRVVESQEQVASRNLVDNLAEQALLEELLESSKPAMPADGRALHYLLASPFRYPPLEYGSRFGSRQEPSLFYGALALAPALAETAFYRLIFWRGMATPPPGGRLTTQHTLFAARYASPWGLRLHEPPFSAHEAVLTDPRNYQATQQLGGNMRKAGVELFIYRSARDLDGGLNIALFTPKAFPESAPLWKQGWLCDTRAEEVAFYHKTEGTRVYPLSRFLVDGELPLPAG